MIQLIRLVGFGTNTANKRIKIQSGQLENDRVIDERRRSYEVENVSEIAGNVLTTNTGRRRYKKALQKSTGSAVVEQKATTTESSIAT